MAIRPIGADDGLGDRIAKAIELAGGPSEVHRRTGISRSLLLKYSKAEAEPGVRRVVAIAKAAGVSVEWLATGEGAMRPMLRAEPATKVQAVPEAAEIMQVLGIPLGTPQHFFRVRDDDMAPTAVPGDWAVLNPADRTLVEGHVYQVTVGDRLYLRRLARMPSDLGWGFVPEHEGRESFAAELPELVVNGRLMGIIRDPKLRRSAAHG